VGSQFAPVSVRGERYHSNNSHKGEARVAGSGPRSSQQGMAGEKNVLMTYASGVQIEYQLDMCQLVQDFDSEHGNMN